MASTRNPAQTPRPVGRSVLLTIPMLLWASLMFSRTLAARGALAPKLGALAAMAFVVTLFFLTVRTRSTFRWRRVFFVALGVLFPVGFIWEMVSLRGSMSIPIEQILAGDTPFCFLAIPMMLVPAALSRTIIFPGSILPTASNPHAIAPMVAIWLLGTLVLGKAWCSYGCFFGGIEEGFAALPRRQRLARLDPRWRWGPWAVLVAIVLLSAASFEATYCWWLCPFKAVTEYAEVRDVTTAIQTGVFLLAFVGLVVVLPVLTRRRTQCAWFCPFGAFQSLSNKLNPFEVRIDRDRCIDCDACRRECPTLALDEASIREGRTLLACMKCGACVDCCPKDAAVWHVKGTPARAAPETARMLFLYGAWGFATLFGAGSIAGSIAKLLGLLT